VSYGVSEAGHFIINDEHLETTNTNLNEHTFEAGHSYVYVGDTVVDANGENSYHTSSGIKAVDEQHLELTLNDGSSETSSGSITTYDLTSSDDTSCDVTVLLDIGSDEFVHELYYTNDSDSMMMLVASTSSEAPAFESDWYGNVYFSDDDIQPVAAFKVSDVNSLHEAGTVTVTTSRAPLS
jgi:hypothetical protein